MLPFAVLDDHAPAILAPGRPHLSYGALTTLTDGLGASLRAAGISSDDRVVLVASDGPEAATAFLAVAGVCQCAPLNPRYRDAEIAHYLEDLRPKLILHTAETPPPAAAQLNIRTARMFVDQAAPAGSFSLPDLPSGTTTAGMLPETALLLHTSGTTSRPKLVPLTWDNLGDSARNIGETLQLTAADRCLNVMPLFHIHGLVAALLTTLRSGASLVCTPGLVAPSFFDWMDEFAPTWYSAVPTMHQAILTRAPRHAEAIRRSRLRFIRSSSAPLPVVVLRELESVFAVPVIEAYGMTEAAHQMTSNQLPPGERKPGSVGRAAGPAVAVHDVEGAPVAAGGEGFVCIRGANVTPGYLENDEANQESFRNGWFNTGDLGRMDDDGYLWLTGRSKEILNRGGEKISPREVDEVLMQHPAIRQCLTFALPDSQLGEEVGVAVVVRPGNILDEAEVQRFAAARLADFKVPRRVFAVDEIPAGPTGKLQRIGLAGRLGITTDSWKPKPESGGPANPAVTTAVAQVMRSVLNLSELDDDTGFFDAGGDSLLASRLLARLEAEFGKTLSIVDLFRASSANAIAARLTTAVATTARAVNVAERHEGPALTSGQVRFWLHDQLGEDPLAAQSPRLFEIRGIVHPDRVRQALVRIIERHEPLRTIIRNDGGTPRAELRPVEPLPWTVHDWTTTPEERREASAREICVRETSRPFALDADLMVRASLHNLGANRWWLLVLMHHSAIDGWSTELLREELQTLLEGGALAPLPARYSDFARWEENALAGDRLDALKKYWVKQLDGLPNALELPLEFPRPARQSYQGRAVSSTLPRAVTVALRDLGRDHQATLFMTLLAGWTSLLSRYTGAADICVGTPVAGRGRVEFESLIGLFANTVVLRNRLDDDPSFAQVIARVRESCLAAWDHDLPFAHVLQAVPHDRTANHSPFYQVYFQLRNFPRAAASTVLPLTELEVDFDVVPADLNLEITETPAGLRCRLQYNSALFTERFGRAMLDHFEALLAGAIAAPDTRLSRLPVMGAEERDTLITRRLPPRRPAASATIVELFERQAETRPEAIAIMHRDRRLTYRDLNAQANRLARALTARGVGPEHVVALCLPRSPEWIAAMLAASKAGGAYMSLEADYPAALIRDLVARSRAALVIADDRSRDALADIAAPVIWTSELSSLLTEGESSNPPLAAAPGNLAHVFFTSGSTGRPKGVATEHRNLSAYLAWHHWMPHSPAETCLQFTSVTFDPAAAEVWGPLTTGGRCAIYSEGLDDPARLGEWIRETGVSMCYLSASVFNTLIDEAPDVLRSVRRILIGGEALSVAHIRRGLDLLPHTELINGYGPTETTVYYTGYRIPRPFNPERTSVPIGRPLDNGCAYIVDRNGQLVPDGLPGELWIGGDTVGRGYLHEPELTAAAFPPAPTGDLTARVYRTGDRARWLPDGELEFLGRIDHQVKVRGVRIELGEIETVLREHPSVRHACVVATTHPTAGTMLAAFVELQDGVATTVAELRAFLAGRLPHQMVPARLAVRASLPLTPSGKIDRRALTQAALAEPQPEPAESRAPARSARGIERAAPSTRDLEAQLAEIWRELLGVGEVGPDDSFFALGGHSLLAVRLAFQIERRFGAHVTLVSLFEASTLSRMAALILGQGAARPIAPAAGAVSATDVPPILCVAAGPLFHHFAEALAPSCRFQSVPTPDDRDSIATMEELAAQIVPSILESHPRGPLMIAGWSLAGVVAIEVAAQLERAGREVPTVILFDTLSPVRHRQWFAESPRVRQWQLNLIKSWHHVEEALFLGVRESLRYLIKTFRDARARAEYDKILRDTAAGKSGQFDVPLDFRQAFGVYAALYTPAPLRARVIVVRPERRKRGGFFSGDLGWAELGYRVRLLIVPGDHERMFAPRNAPVLAGRLLEAIKDTENG